MRMTRVPSNDSKYRGNVIFEFVVPSDKLNNLIDFMHNKSDSMAENNQVEDIDEGLSTTWFHVSTDDIDTLRDDWKRWKKGA